MAKIVITLLVTCLLLSIMPQGISRDETAGVSSSGIARYVTGELIIGFKDDIKVNLLSSKGEIQKTGILSIDNLNIKYGVKSAKRLIKDDSNLPLSNIYKLILRNYDTDILATIKEYEANQYVKFAEPNYIGSYCSTPTDYEQYRESQSTISYQNFNIKSNTVIPNDPYFNLQWGLHNTGQTGGTVDADIDAPEAWNLEKGNGEVIIAIIDSGVDYTHPDLAGNIWNNTDEIPNNGIDDDNNGFIDDIRGWDFLGGSNDPRDYFGHGTHCAGIAAAVTSNDIGIAGVCWNCKIMPVRVCNYTTIPDFAVAEGVIYAANNGADIISISLGWVMDISVLNDAINYAYNKGVVVVAAAGNAGNYGFPFLTFPGRHNKVIGVGAINQFGERYYKSSWGPSLDVVAPGENIFSTLPAYHVLLNDFGLNQSYDNISGTSMASPCVAGIAALILSHNSTLKNYQVSDILKSTATDLGSEGKDWYFGYGLVNACKAVEKSSDYKVQSNDYEFELDQSGYSEQLTQNQVHNL
jgi:subtilisin family serine protease